MPLTTGSASPHTVHTSMQGAPLLSPTEGAAQQQQQQRLIPSSGPDPDSSPSAASIATATDTVVAASVASLLTKSLLHPLDTIKCRVQIYSSLPGAHAAHVHRRALKRQQQQVAADLAHSTHPHPHPHRYSPAAAGRSVFGSVAAAARHGTARFRGDWRGVYRQYDGKWGARFLYGGLPVKLLFYVPYQAVYMTSYNATRDTLTNHLDARQALQQQGENGAVSPSASLLRVSCTVLAAVAAELSSCIVRVPMETIKMRVQATAAGGTLDAMRQMRRHGFLACARLAVPQTLMHDIPYSIAQWVTYEAMRPKWGVRAQEADISSSSSSSNQSGGGGGGALSRYKAELLRTFISGGCSGLIAATVTLPLDNIRTRVVVATARDPRLTVREVVRVAYNADGLTGFVRGGSMRVLWVTANMACYFPLFEFCRAVLVRQQQQQ